MKTKTSLSDEYTYISPPTSHAETSSSHQKLPFSSGKSDCDITASSPAKKIIKEKELTKADERKIDQLINAIIRDGTLTFCYQTLDSKMAEIISQTLQRSPVKHLQEIKLRNCNISDKFLKTILTNEVTVGTLNLSANKGLNIKTVKRACDDFQVEILDVSGISLSGIQVSDLAEITRIKKLELRANTFAGDSIGSSLAALINGGLETLILYDSEISEEDLHNLAEQISPGNKLSGLDLSHITLNKMGAEALCQIITKAKEIEWIYLHNCGLDGEMLEKLAGTNANDFKPKVKKLKLSANPKIKDSIAKVAEVAVKLNCEDIDISRNCLRGDDFKNLATADYIPRQISTIHIRENPVGNWAAIGELVMNWNLSTVNASKCRMYVQDAEYFAALLEEHFTASNRKLDEINVLHADRDKKFTPKIKSLLTRIAEEVKA